MTIERYDHLAIPMQDAAAMTAFYRGLGFQIEPYEQSGYQYFAALLGNVRINLQLRETWECEGFETRADCAAPGSASFCMVWSGTLETLASFLVSLEIEIVSGPVPRVGGHLNGTASGQSVYVHDPDGNLLEFIVYA